MTTPTLSVVMITYNGARFIREQINSLLRQTLPFTELIIQDDQSTDGTRDIIAEYAQNDKRIRLYVNQHNMGWNMNFITAMRRATGDYIALCDQDDIWFDDNLEKKMAAIGTKSLVCCYRSLDPVFTTHSKNIRSLQTDFESILFTSHIPGHSMLFSRSFYKSIDVWDKRIAYDWWLALQAHMKNGMAVVREPLNWYREHEDSASVIMMKKDWERTKGNTWQPYVYGLKAYRAFQQMPVWQWMYSYIREHTADGRHSLAHKLASLMVKPGIGPLLHLCWLTMKHRRLVHDRFAGGKGLGYLLNCTRGFFYPLIRAYNNNTAFFEKPESQNSRNVRVSS